jgi:hypothetical protein
MAQRIRMLRVLAAVVIGLAVYALVDAALDWSSPWKQLVMVSLPALVVPIFWLFPQSDVPATPQGGQGGQQNP